MKLLKNKYGFLFLFSLLLSFVAKTQDSVARELILKIGYYKPVDNLPYLKISATEKVDRKFIPQKDITASVYIGEEIAGGLLEKIKTDKNGEYKIFIPASFKSTWESASTFSFIAVTEATKIFQSTKSEMSVTKAKIELDTSSADGAKSITVKVNELKEAEWRPAKNVELKIAVRRSLGNLPVGDEESYTTDSTGSATAEFKRDSLYGDEKGNYTIIARTEDNDVYGNIFTEKIVNWGVVPVQDKSFYQRSLWATRSRTPIWLLALAYSIIAGVWGTLIYLVRELLKIKKLGKITA
jgi:hypothetical protein